MEQHSERLPGECVGVHVCLPVPLGGFLFFFPVGFAVFGDISFPMLMHKMFGLPGLIILQNNGKRLAAARSPDACHTLSRARCLCNCLLLLPVCLRRRGDV